MACPDEVVEEKAEYIIHGAAPGHRGRSNTHPHRRSSVPVVKGATHVNHKRVSCADHHASPSHIFGHYLVIKDRTVTLLSSQLPLAEEALHTSRHIAYNDSAHNAKPPNIPHTKVSNNRITQTEECYEFHNLSIYDLGRKTATPDVCM